MTAPLSLPFDPARLPRAVTVALVEAPPVYFDAERALATALKLVRRAKAAGARLMAFSESWWGGYPLWVDCAPSAAMWEEPGLKQLHGLLVTHALDRDGPHLASLRACAHELGIDIALGAHERHGRSLLNSIFLIGADGQLKIRRKLVPTHGERLVWAPGHTQDFAPLPTLYGGVSAAICWEHWMPELRALLHRGEALLHVAAWPVLRPPYALASRHFAFEGRAFVLAVAGRVRRQDLTASLPKGAEYAAARDLLAGIASLDADGLLLGGGVAVFGPDGEEVQQQGREGDIRLFTLHPHEALEAAANLDVAGHYSRPDLIRVTLTERGS